MAIDAILRIQEVVNATGYQRPTIYKKIKEGNFPRQVQLGARAVGWLESEVQEWVQARIDARDAVA